MGKTLGEYMGWGVPTTHREHTAWCEWLLLKANRPSTLEMYVMQTAAEVRRGHVKNPKSVKIEDLRLSFSRGNEGSGGNGRKPTQYQTQVAKAVWAGRVGGNVQHRTITKEEAEQRGLLPPKE